MNQLTKLQLTFPNINDSGIEALADMLNITNVNRFYLFNMNFSDEAGVTITNTLSSMSIKRLALSSPLLGDDTVYALAKVIQNSPLITELWIEGDFITDEGAKFFAQVIQNSLLDTVCLNSKSVTDQGLITLTASLVTLPLQILTIGSYAGDAGLIDLFKQLNRTNIQHFDLRLSSFTNTSMQILADNLPSTTITTLLFEQINLSPQLVSQLAPAIAASAIKTFGIYSSDFSDSLTSLGPGLGNVNTLIMSDVNLTDSSIIALAPFLSNSKMEEIQLDYNQIGDLGITALCKILPLTMINYLELINNNLSDISAVELANIFPHSALQTLYLQGNNISTDALYKVQNLIWQEYCQDKLCHTNAQYNNGQGLQVQPSVRKKALARKKSSLERWNFAANSLEVIKDHSLATTVDTSDHSALPGSSVSSAESWLTPSAAGAMIVGMVGFTLLLYKNVTLVRTVVDSGCKVLQSCFCRTGDSLKTATNFYSFHSFLKNATRTARDVDSRPSNFQMVG
ncbi:MAG: hypothetical protein JSR33_06790 [Proteobacteria bacterium]|nr:hypothetical protein [Pseudomonadota bacterium]